MEKYVLVIAFKPGTGEAQVEAALAKIEKKMTSLGGTIQKKPKPIMRKLASRMRKFNGVKEGLFAEFEFEGPGTLPNELNTLIRVNEDVMRFMITKAPEDIQQAEEKEAESAVEVNPEMLIGKPE
ncbi:MAG: 30S ribosomal protein S6 [Candidatus Margulisiibacteriota bacterium]